MITIAASLVACLLVWRYRTPKAAHPEIYDFGLFDPSEFKNRLMVLLRRTSFFLLAVMLAFWLRDLLLLNVLLWWADVENAPTELIIAAVDIILGLCAGALMALLWLPVERIYSSRRNRRFFNRHKDFQVAVNNIISHAKSLYNSCHALASINTEYPFASTVKNALGDVVRFGIKTLEQLQKTDQRSSLVLKYLDGQASIEDLAKAEIWDENSIPDPESLNLKDIQKSLTDFAKAPTDERYLYVSNIKEWKDNVVKKYADNIQDFNVAISQVKANKLTIG